MYKYFFNTHVEHTGNMKINMYRVSIFFNLIVGRGMPTPLTAGGVVKATDVFQRLKES